MLITSGVGPSTALVIGENPNVALHEKTKKNPQYFDALMSDVLSGLTGRKRDVEIRKKQNVSDSLFLLSFP